MSLACILDQPQWIGDRENYPLKMTQGWHILIPKRCYSFGIHYAIASQSFFFLFLIIFIVDREASFFFFFSLLCTVLEQQRIFMI